jgi:hypothetical protein
MFQGWYRRCGVEELFLPLLEIELRLFGLQPVTLWLYRLSYPKSASFIEPILNFGQRSLKLQRKIVEVMKIMIEFWTKKKSILPPTSMLPIKKNSSSKITQPQ